LEHGSPTSSKTGSRRWASRLGALAGLAAVGVVVWLLTAYAHLFAIAIVIAVGWFLHRYASAVAVGLCVTAATLAVVGHGMERLFGDQVEWIAIVCGAGAGIAYFAAGIVFFVASLKNRARCAGNCAGFMILFFTFVIAVMAAKIRQESMAGPEAVQETRQMIVTLHRLAAEIEDIHAKTGRYPADEAELVALRGRSMPQYHPIFRISYVRFETDSRRDRGEYQLQCSASHFWGRHWDLFAWIFHFYGTDATQRVYVETF
jgi:hypothetical protein